MENAERPSAAPPVAPAPTPPVRTGPCLDCGLSLALPETELCYRKTPGQEFAYTYELVCAACRSAESAENMLREAHVSLQKKQAVHAYMVVCVYPALRKAGLSPKYVMLDYSGDIGLQCHDREEGMALAGALGHLLDKKNLWDKKQEYDEATLRLSGRITLSREIVAEIVIMGVPPSPACRIVWEEIDVPASKRKRAKIVCDDAPAAPSA